MDANRKQTVLKQCSDPVIMLLGPTAIGKTELSLNIAEKYSGQIVGVDSQQVYRYMDIGTAKPTTVERSQVPHHLIDIADPDENYNAARFLEDSMASIDAIHKSGDIPILTGGTGLYFKSLLEGLFEMSSINDEIKDKIRNRLEKEGRGVLLKELSECDPESAARIHPNDTQRLVRALEIYESTGFTWSELINSQQKEPYLLNVLKIGLTCDREKLYDRINRRVSVMVDLGFEAEVRSLLEMGYTGSLNSMQSIGYRHMVNFIEGRWERDESLQLLARDTRRYAKRQYTWFRRDQKIQWFEPKKKDKVCCLIDKYLKSGNYST